MAADDYYYYYYDKQTDSDVRQFYRPCKARDIFVAASDVLPVPFMGGLMNILVGDMRTWPTANVQPQQCLPKSADARRWSIVSRFTLNMGGLKPSGLWLSAAYNVNVMPYGCVSAMVDANLNTGLWGFETAGTFDDNCLDVSVSGQMCTLKQPVTLRLDVDYKLPKTTLSLTVDPVRRTWFVQCLQAISDRILVGVDFDYYEHHYGNNQYKKQSTVALASSSVLIKYAGPNYLISGKLNPIMRIVKLAYYYHLNDWLQAATIHDMDVIRSEMISRLAFRVLSDVSVFRAAVDTNGFVSGVWDKKLNKNMSISLCTFLNMFNLNNLKIGIGLSFE